MLEDLNLLERCAIEKDFPPEIAQAMHRMAQEAQPFLGLPGIKKQLFGNLKALVDQSLAGEPSNEVNKFSLNCAKKNKSRHNCAIS